MRFKAKLAPEQLSMLYQVMNPLSRIASGGGADGGGPSSSAIWTRNGSILYLDDEYFRISTRGKTDDTDNIRCFAEFSHDIFLEHRIESAADRNAIVMEVDITQLRQALQSLCQGDGSRSSNRNQDYNVTMVADPQLTLLKLAKRDGIPCLCLSGGGASTSVDVQVHHSIPVRIRRAAEMPHYLPPKIDAPDVQLELMSSENSVSTSAMLLRPLLEGLRPLSSTVYLQATTAGDLTVSIDSDGASIRTFYNNLPVRLEDCKQNRQLGSQPDHPAATSCTVKVDTKKLWASLQWQQQPLLGWISSALLCLVENEMLVVHAVLHPPSVGFFTYYVPVHFLPKDIRDE